MRQALGTGKSRRGREVSEAGARYREEKGQRSMQSSQGKLKKMTDN